MKNTLFIATYFNNPHFIDLQVKSFKKFVQDEYDFAVIDDSDANTVSLLSGQRASDEIRNECSKYGVRHIAVPQSVHAPISQGGLVPLDNEFAGIHHPTVRHQAVLRWIFDNHRSLGFDQYQTLVLLDADMFFKQPVNMKQYMEDYDMMGSWRDLLITQEHLALNSSDEVRNMLGTKFKHFTLCLLLINMQTVKNLETFNNASFARVTDTGGKTKYFIEGNHQYKFNFMKDFNSQEYRLDFFSKTTTIQDEAEIIHYRGGSNWDYQTKDYYYEKLYRMLKRFAPDLCPPEWKSVGHDLASRSGEHVFKKE